MYNFKAAYKQKVIKMNEERDEKEFIPQIIETIDEDGNTIELELIQILNIDGIEYALLKLVDDEEENEEYDEAVVMRLLQTSDEYLFVAIEDDEEFERVSNYIEELSSLDESEEEEE